MSSKRKRDEQEMLQCIFNRLQDLLKKLNFYYPKKRKEYYSLALASGTNRSYMINYVYKNIHIEITMMKKIDEIFVIFKNHQWKLNETISFYIDDYVQKVDGVYRFNNDAKLNKMLNIVIIRLNQMLPSPSSLTSSIATTSTGDNLGFNGNLFSSRMDSSTTPYLYNIGQPEKFIPHAVPSSINQNLRKQCDMDKEELNLNRTYGPDNGIAYDPSINQASKRILNPNIGHISTSIDLMNLPPHMKIQNINSHHRKLGPSDSINPIHYAGSLSSCHSMNPNGMIISDPDDPSYSSKFLLPLPPSSDTMQQHLHHLPPSQYLKIQNMDPLLAPPPNHQQQHMGPLLAPPPNHHQQQHMGPLFAPPPNHQQQHMGLSPMMNISFGMGPPPHRSLMHPSNRQSLLNDPLYHSILNDVRNC